MEMPGIETEEDVVAPVTNIGPSAQRVTRSMEDRASRAMRNASFGPRKVKLLHRDNDAMGQREEP